MRRLAELVDLVVYQQLRDLAGADFGQHRVDLGDALGAQRVGRVDDVQQQVRFARLAQGGADRGDPFVRQVADQAAGAGRSHGSAGSFEAATGGPEGGALVFRGS